MVDVKKSAPITPPASRIDGASAPTVATPQVPNTAQTGKNTPNISDFQRITGSSGGRMGLTGRASRAPQIEVSGVRDTAAGHFARIEEFGEIKIPTPVLEHLLYS